jgi:hypothetical protein
LPSRRTLPQPTLPDLSAEKAHSVLKTQLQSLQPLKGLRYTVGRPKEKEWSQLSGKLITRAFGSASENAHHFSRALGAGSYSIRFGGGEDHAQNQNNYDARIGAYETVVNSCLAELKLDLPEPEIQGVFEPGQEYEFYRTVRTILEQAKGPRNNN